MEDPLYCIWIVESPCLKPEVWAAWAQAILSVAAIRFAARLAFEQERRARKRRLDSLMELFILALDKAQLAYDRAIHRLEEPFIGDTLGFARLTSAFKAVPFHDLPDSKLLPLIDMGVSACEDLDQHFDQLKSINGKHSISSIDTLAIAMDTLDNCVEEAMKAANDALPPTKLWWFVRRTWRRLRKGKSRLHMPTYNDTFD